MAGVASLLLASTAFAGGRYYSGAIAGDDATAVSMKLKKRDGRLWLTSFVARSFVITCDEGVEARLRSAAVRARPRTIPVSRKGHFQARVEKGPKVVELNGTLDGRTGATGTLRYSGLTTVMVGGGEESLDCHSELLHWAVAREDQATGRIAASMP
jgi:hypothetical protein